jgi:hypothetical protein
MNNTTVMLLGYIGPETMLPLASILAAGVGVILMFWKYIIQLIRRMFGAIFRIFRRKKKNVDTTTALPNNSEAKKPMADNSVLVKNSDQESGGDA